MELKSKRGGPKKKVNVIEEEKLAAKQREKNRLRKRQYRASRSQEAYAREKDKNRLFMRKIRASLTDEKIER
jgi:hypothetical protein